MKYLRIATTLLVVLALVANVSFAAGSRTGQLQKPVREAPEVLSKAAMKVASAPVSQLKGLVDERTPVVASAATLPAGYQTQFTKTNVQVPREILASGLSGTFHIGTANQFKTLADVAFLLNIANISGPVTFLLDDASYTEAAGILIGGSPGASETNLITIRPNTGNTNCVITIPNNHANGGGLVLSGAEYVVINGTADGEAAGSRNLSIALTASPSSAQGGDAPVRLTNCANVTVANCVITGNSPSAVMSQNGLTNGNASVSINATTGFYNTDITVDNCDLSGGHFGVLSLGNYMKDYDSYGVQDRYFNITNNYIHDVTENGVKLYQVTGANVSNNVIKRVVLGSTAGGAWALKYNGGNPTTTGTSTATLTANLPIWYRVSGITVWGDEAVIANNLVDSIWSNRTAIAPTTGPTGSGNIYGIRLIGFGQNDPDPSFGGGLSMGGVITGSMIKNNIITRVHAPNVQQANGYRFSAVGLAIEAGRWDTVVHNTVYMSGTGTGVASGEAAFQTMGTTTSSYGIYSVTPWFGNGAGLIAAYSYRCVVKNNIFAVDRTSNGTDNAVLALTNAGGVVDVRPPSDYNVLYLGTAGVVQTQASGAGFISVFDYQNAQAAAGYTTDVHSQADSPTLVSESDVNISASGYSTADGSGIAYPGVGEDYAGVTRGNPPDIGALEGTGLGLPHDTKANGLVSPGAAGVPQGLPVADFTVGVLNLGGYAESSVPLNIHVIAPSLATVDFSTTFNAAPGEYAEVSVPGPWTPTEAGTYTLVITTGLVGDNYPSNDTVIATVPVNGQATVPYTSGFETGELTGWFADGDFGLGTTGQKLGGPRTGTSYYVTKPGAIGSGTTDKTVSMLYSPYFDFTGVTAATMSFYHSLSTEPSWDRSIVEYSLDTGKTWHQLGVLNDANGINWYSTAVYQNAAGNADACWDEATASSKGFPSDNPGVMPTAQFTSNGDCEHDSQDGTLPPVGYVLVAYTFDNMPAETTPLGKSFVRFRYVTFCDAATHGDGWAVDDFRIEATAPASTPGAFSGKVYNDVAGDFTFNGSDAGIADVIVTLTYFGAPVATDTTDSLGDYLFPNTNATTGMYLPGVYAVTTNYTGGASTENNEYSYTGDGNPYTAGNVGFYNGSISGKVFSDINDNGVNDSDPGFAGFVVDVYHDDADGDLAGSFTTTSSGLFTFAVVPDTYYVAVTAPTVQYRQTMPESTYTVIVSGDGGSGTAVITGQDFGFFKRGTIRVMALQDQNGNGSVDLLDVAALKAGVYAAFSFYAADTLVRVDTIGSLTKDYAVANLEVGTYRVDLNVGAPAQTGWMLTTAATFTVNVANSEQADTLKFLFWQYPSIAGTVFNDLNGNGVKDGGDLGLEGQTVMLDGTTPATTDGSGNYIFSGLLPGSHTVAVSGPSGWTVTMGVANYTQTPTTGQNLGGKNFGLFQNFSVAGSTYRDRDNNGAQNGADNGLMDVVLSLTKDGNPLSTVNSDASGLFSFTDLGPGAYVLTATTPTGYGQTEPASLGTYSFSGASGTNVTGQIFGFFKLDDSVKYRTITVADLIAGSSVKPSKNAKADTVANIGNLVNNLITSITVGYPGQLNGAGKTKAYMQPKKYSDVYTTVNSKKAGAHTGTPSGFDFTVKSAVMLKKQTSVGADKHNNVLVANMLALNINLQASVNGNTAAGLGNLVINNGGAFNGLSIAKFVDSVNYLMTNWEKVPQTTWDAANTLAGDINAAFNEPFAYDATIFRASGTAATVVLTGGATVYSTSFLKPGTEIVPVNRFQQDQTEVPTVYALYQNYPNPFNPSTTIRFDLPMASFVTVKIYNMLGQEVATVFDREEFSEGQQEVDFNASILSSGVYFYRIIAEGQNAEGAISGQTFTQVMKMALVK